MYVLRLSGDMPCVCVCVCVCMCVKKNSGGGRTPHHCGLVLSPRRLCQSLDCKTFVILYMYVKAVFHWMRDILFDDCSSITTLRRAVASGSTTSGWPTRPSGGTNHLAQHSKARVCLRVLHVLSADEMSWRLSMVPMHWVFEYPRSRLYTYLSLSLPSGIVVCICGRRSFM